MVMPIKPNGVPLAEFLNSARAPSSAGAPGVGSTGGSSGTSSPDRVEFSEKLREVLNEANSTQQKAETAAADFASGKQNDLHGTMVSMAQADISLRLVSNVRNRVIEAYREVMRMGS